MRAAGGRENGFIGNVARIYILPIHTDKECKTLSYRKERLVA